MAIALYKITCDDKTIEIKNNNITFTLGSVGSLPREITEASSQISFELEEEYYDVEARTELQNVTKYLNTVVGSKITIQYYSNIKGQYLSLVEEAELAGSEFGMSQKPDLNILSARSVIYFK